MTLKRQDVTVVNRDANSEICFSIEFAFKNLLWKLSNMWKGKMYGEGIPLTLLPSFYSTRSFERQSQITKHSTIETLVRVTKT